ncbi:MAG: sigma-70 domain-containing protein [Planctomycetota bacterium]
MPDLDLQLWKKWASGGRKKADLQSLLQRFEPLVNKQVSVYKRTNIPDSAIKAHAQLNLVDAFETYSPDRGVKLNSWVNTNQRKILRYVTSLQNFAKIPEPMVYRIAEFNMAERDLEDKLNRPPSVMELADQLKWPPKHVERMRKVQRKDLSATMYEADPGMMQGGKWREVKSFLPFELDAQSNAVWEAINNAGRPMSTAELARKLKMSTSAVTRSRKKVGDTISRFMEV